MSPQTTKEHAEPVRDEQLTAAVLAGREALHQTALALCRLERQALALEEAARLILAAPGCLVVTGIGKSGLIGAKLAATMASTGTTAFFVHAADALHGDAGRVGPGDVLLALSNSGETPEVRQFAALARQRGAKVLAVTGCLGNSSLARLANVRLDAHADREADPYDLVPTASTTVALAVGDALAITLMVARQFGPGDFREHHPAGYLGERLREQPAAGNVRERLGGQPAAGMAGEQPAPAPGAADA